MHRLPPFRWKLVFTPLGLHHPTWINDPGFDLDWHVRRVAVPTPGGPRELCDLISEIASRPLDRTRPLWELWMVEGLEGGQVAAVAKVHHAVADGISSAELLNEYHDNEPNLETEPAPPWTPEQPPSKLMLLVLGISAVLRSLFAGLPELLKAAKAAKQRRTIAGLGRVGDAAQAVQGADPALQPTHHPSSLVHVRVGCARRREEGPDGVRLHDQRRVLGLGRRRTPAVPAEPR